jgi:histidine triad (HIT) family protein
LHNHAPTDYICPFCLLIQGIENEHNEIKQADIVYQNTQVTTFIAIRKWPNNAGHVLVIPNTHFENIYDLPIDIATEIHKIAKAVAITMKEVYACDGILLRQHNELAGEQKIWHYHLHIIPRYENDNLHLSQKQPFPPDERAQYARRLNAMLQINE